MKKGYTHISVVLDSSGSMASIHGATIEGYNAFLKEQKSVKGEGTLTQIRFRNNWGGFRLGGAFGSVAELATHEVIENFVKLADAKELTTANYIVSGGTPLLDAIGNSIKETGRTLAAMKEEDRPDKVIFVILTDGGENASKQFTKEQIKSMINEQTNVYKWDFMYIGANQDSIAEAANYGIAAGFASNYNADAVSTRATFGVMSAKMGNYRGIVDKDLATQSLNFTAEERAAMVAPNAADAGAGVQVNVGVAVGAGAIQKNTGAGVK